ncbi:MAG TPA: hypothetical protein V6D47_05750 [Oscillatoriaceae cyanobacterium]
MPKKEDTLNSLRGSMAKHDHQVMEQFKRIINETSFELDPICVYVIMDKLRGMHNSAGIAEKSYKKAEQMLRVLGVDKYWEH